MSLNADSNDSIQQHPKLLLSSKKGRSSRTLTLLNSDTEANCSIVPFAYGYSLGLRPISNGHLACAHQVQFTEIQRKIFEHAVQILHAKHSVLLALHTGAGKCIHANTEVAMYGHTYSKRANQLKIGDLLVSGSNTAVKITALGKGLAIGYDVRRYRNGTLLYTCNYDHLCTHVLISDCKRLRQISWETCALLAYKETAVGIIEQQQRHVMIPRVHRCAFHPTSAFESIFQMQPHGVEYLHPDACRCTWWYRNEALVSVYFIQTNWHAMQTLLDDLGWSYCERTNLIYVPFYVRTYEDYVRTAYAFQKLEVWERRSFEHAFVERSKIVIEYVGIELERKSDRRFQLANGIITHNTVLSSALIGYLQKPTLVFVHRNTLIPQWIAAISKFIRIRYRHDKVAQPFRDPVIQVFDRNTGVLVDTEILIATLHSITPEYQSALRRFETVVFDEAHVAGAPSFLKALQTTHPVYLIGLSASPYRVDGFSNVLQLYFGDQIRRRMIHPHVVWVYSSEQTYGVEKSYLNMLKKQSFDAVRNRMIVDVIRQLSPRRVLVFCKFVEHVHILHEMLGKDVAQIFVGRQQDYRKTHRVLLTTHSKLGVGFDDATIYTLIVASSFKSYPEQPHGRIFRNCFHKYDEHALEVQRSMDRRVMPMEDVRMVIEIRDQSPLFEKHLRVRLQYYQRAGGTISYH